MLPHSLATCSHIYYPPYVNSHSGNVFPYIYIYHPPYVTKHWQCLPIYITHLMLPHPWATFSHIYIYISPTLCYHTLGQHFLIYITHLMLPHTWATFSHVYHPYTGWIVVSCPSQKCFNPITCVSVSQPLGFQQPDNHTGPSKGNWWQGIYIYIYC